MCFFQYLLLDYFVQCQCFWNLARQFVQVWSYQNTCRSNKQKANNNATIKRDISNIKLMQETILCIPEAPVRLQSCKVGNAVVAVVNMWHMNGKINTAQNKLARFVLSYTWYWRHRSTLNIWPSLGNAVHLYTSKWIKLSNVSHN